MPRKKYPVAVFLGTLTQIVPTAYIVATGTVPTWARITLSVFIALWLLLLVAQETAAG